MSKESLGIINWWGFTPSLNLIDENIINYCSSEEVNILIVGSGDSRHILKTISKLYKREGIKINFYIIENGIELYSRYILQLVLALVPLNKIGLQEKTEVFLELYGNTLVRQQSMDFVRRFSNEMINLITDPESWNNMLPFINLDHIKIRDRDIFESVFKVWRSKEPKSFDASLCWDLRIRQNLGVRYDAIPNVFDWDCSMVLHDREATIVNSREYCHWRHKGVAFQLRDANYDVSNRTLASGRVLRTAAGDKTFRLGYWGDIVCSPYLGFGIRSENKNLFKKMNNQFTWGSERVSEYNLTQIMYEVANKQEYVEKKEDNDEKEKVKSKSEMTIEEVDEDQITESGKQEELLQADQPTEKSEADCVTDDKSQIIDTDLLQLPNVTVTFLPLNALDEYLFRKSKFQQLFNLIYFSTSLIGYIDKDKVELGQLLHPTGSVIVETPQFIVNINKEQLKGYEQRIEEMMSKLQLEKCSPQPDVMQDTGHILFSSK